ncbi:ribosomal RNA processing protein 36 homolog [Amphiura filiformis]|uniref:ribosomal RNA processing protein 36 homolog n=1 Tax=Amphiura filiformis TaxID=82378 RepID=UPI003B21AB3B
MKQDDLSNSSSSSAEDDSSSEQHSEEDSETKEKMDSIRKELSEVPFEELQELQDRVGSKVYNEALFGSKSTKQSAPQGMQKRSFKRANKNRPQEISSKKPVSRFRDVFQTKKKINRDPRFDDLSGEFHEESFSSNYSFIKNIRQRERQQIEKEMKKTKDLHRKEQLKSLIQRMDQQETAKDRKDKSKIAEREHKKQERELVKQGKKPFFLKKSEQKKMELAEKYKQLKKSGKVEKYLMQKRKKNATKDRRHLPHTAGAPH